MDYVRIQGSRGGYDGDPWSARQLLDAQIEGATSFEVYDVYYADSGMHGKRFVLGRTFMHANISAEYEC